MKTSSFAGSAISLFFITSVSIFSTMSSSSSVWIFFALHSPTEFVTGHARLYWLLCVGNSLSASFPNFFVLHNSLLHFCSPVIFIMVF